MCADESSTMTVVVPALWLLGPCLLDRFDVTLYETIARSCWCSCVVWWSNLPCSGIFWLFPQHGQFRFDSFT